MTRRPYHRIVTGGGEGTEQIGPAPEVNAGTPKDPTGQFVAAVLGSTEDVWKEIFAANGLTYHPPKLTAPTTDATSKQKRKICMGLTHGA